MMKVKIYRCPICKKPYSTLGGWINHMNQNHPENRPEDFSDSRYFYYIYTGKVNGRCIICKNATEWNESTGKYSKFCTNPNCKEKYRNQFKERMISKYGKVHLLDDPSVQREMLKHRRISGSVKFNDGGMVDYVGSYEKDFLEMCNTFLGLKSKDIMAPSPHTYKYMYDGAEHFYIPDFFIPDLNLEIEIKDDTTTHPKILAVDKVKEKNKDDVMNSIKDINYIKLLNKKYIDLFYFLLNLKNSIPESDLLKSNSEKYNIVLESMNSNINNDIVALESVSYGLKHMNSTSKVSYNKSKNNNTSDIIKNIIILINGIRLIPEYKKYEYVDSIKKIIKDNNININLEDFPLIRNYV